jgi:hypothetical protein
MPLPVGERRTSDGSTVANGSGASRREMARLRSTATMARTKKATTELVALPNRVRHPKDFIRLWIDEFLFVFQQSERKYRSLERGAPREETLRRALREFLPQRFGVAAGHVISGKPAWSQQSDVIIYDALNAPIFSRDEGHQGLVIPVESVLGIIEVKSTLSKKELKDALEKVAQFKRLCADAHVGSHRLDDRFGAVFAYRIPDGTRSEQDARRAEVVKAVEEYPLLEQVDDILVVGNGDSGFLISKLPFGAPDGPPGVQTVVRGRKSLPTFLVRLLDERFRRIRTGMPDDHLSYLFESGVEIHEDAAPDDKGRRNIGAIPVNTVAAEVLTTKASAQAACGFCGGKIFTGHPDVYYLISARDFYFGKIGAPYIPVTVFQCSNCGQIQMHSTTLLGLT